MEKAKGRVVSVNESLVGVENTAGEVMNGEVAYIFLEDGKRLKSEVIDVKSANLVFLQVFEDTKWMKVGDEVEFSGLPLTVKLGPGILGSVTDGLQNPLYELVKIEWFLERGLEVEPLDNSTKWHFTPQIKIYVAWFLVSSAIWACHLLGSKSRIIRSLWELGEIVRKLWNLLEIKGTWGIDSLPK